MLITACTSRFEENLEVVGPNLTKEQWDGQRSVLVDKENFVTRGDVEID